MLLIAQIAKRNILSIMLIIFTHCIVYVFLQYKNTIPNIMLPIQLNILILRCINLLYIYIYIYIYTFIYLFMNINVILFNFEKSSSR